MGRIGEVRGAGVAKGVVLRGGLPLVLFSVRFDCFQNARDLLVRQKNQLALLVFSGIKVCSRWSREEEETPRR